MTGQVEILPYQDSFWVMCWCDDHRDSGQVEFQSDCRQEAIGFAKAWSLVHSFELTTAELLPFVEQGA